MAWLAVVVLLAAGWLAVPAHAAPVVTGPRVLRVGSWDGVNGTYRTIQAAVDAARPGDWVLVGPGDYHEQDDHTHGVRWDTPGGVVITTRGIHVRGMNRNTVVVDGTKPGSPACTAKPSDQDFGVKGAGGSPLGRNGVLIWKADGVSVDNLTICNFLTGSDSSGNEIWWNGGDNSAKIGGFGYSGSYLTATSSYYGGESTAAAYGIFSSNWSGGTWDQTYASNFNDSGLYIGACQQVCDQTVDHAHAEYNALGYSGSNSGGPLTIENSEFDKNEEGLDTNSQNGDNPPPQDGRCPAGAISPISHTDSCWVFIHNYVHDNNNPNVPTAGSAAAGPVGTGMTVSGGRFDTVMDNRFEDNDAWGVAFVIYPDSGPPCTGGVNLPELCLFDGWGNALVDNSFAHNGGFGNLTNGDFAELNFQPGPADCFHGNTDDGPDGLTSSPPDLEVSAQTCGGTALPDPDPLFGLELACDSQISVGPTAVPCLPTENYPRQTHIVMHPVPPQATMPNPCAGVPANPWCPARSN